MTGENEVGVTGEVNVEAIGKNNGNRDRNDTKVFNKVIYHKTKQLLKQNNVNESY